MCPFCADVKHDLCTSKLSTDRMWIRIIIAQTCAVLKKGSEETDKK